MRPTIKDIAAKTGLSVTTVSLVLNNKPSRISAETRELVFKTAKELKYRPNQAAVLLRSGESKTIGLIVPDIRNDFYGNLAKGVEDYCQQHDQAVILCNSTNSYEREREHLNILDSKGVDGIILTLSATGSLETTQKTIDKLTNSGIPFVMFDRSVVSVKSNIVSGDHFHGGYLATQHLLDLGHTKIACITGPSYLEGSASRFAGYQQALEERGIALDQSLVVASDYSFEGGFDAFDALYKKDFSAVFAFNDMMAFGALKNMESKGIRVPEDLSLVGYDDVFFSQIVNPPLTTIHQPAYEIGMQSAKVLLDINAGTVAPPYLKIYKPQLIVRGSTKKI